jgi:hypothetical protein
LRYEAVTKEGRGSTEMNLPSFIGRRTGFFAKKAIAADRLPTHG